MSQSVAHDESQLVLGLVSGLAPATFTPFVSSLRRAGYHGQIGLVTAGYDASDLQRIRALVDHVWVVDGQYLPALRLTSALLRRLRSTRVVWRAYPLAFRFACMIRGEAYAMSRWQRLQFELQSLISLRCGHFYDVVHSLPAAREVMVTDVRDVIFQDDPFRGGVSGLEVFAEEPPATIRAQEANSNWIRELYGREALEVIADNPISCSGTVIGDRESILHYLSEMRQESFWHRQPLTAHDQGIHNYLLWTGRLEPKTLVANGEGRVLSMALMASYERDERGYVLNRDGAPVAVVHQYDRHPELWTELPRLLGD